MLSSFTAFVGEALEFPEIACRSGSSGEVFARDLATFIEEFVEFVHVVAGVRQVGEPVERLLVAGVGERARSASWSD